jgi:cell division protein FtsI (penicillin-binding protein 3)
MYCENGRMQVDNIVIRDTHPQEWLTVPQILAYSSNICAAKIGLTMGGQELYESFLRFGFGQESGLHVPGETSGVLRPRERPWVQVETASASFGQGISVSTLQLAMAGAAIANGGELMQPILIKRVRASSGAILREATREVRRRAVPSNVARVVADMMVAVTEGEGTGTNAAVAGFQVAGKTATAQKADPVTGEYSIDKYVASFVGFVPAKDPVVAIAVTVDEPMIAHAGGEVAAPIFRKVAEMALKYRGLTPGGSKRVDVKQLASSADPANATYALLRQSEGKAPSVQEFRTGAPLAAGQIRVPDMTGWPVRQVVKKSNELGIHTRIVGSGLVARQSPSPGEPLGAGAILTLEFEPAS